MKKIASINYSKFLLEKNKPYAAFVWLGKNFIQFAISDAAHTKIEVIESYKKQQGNITGADATDIFENKILQGAEEICVGLESKKNTLIPNDLFKSEHKESYLKKIYDIEIEETVAAQEIKPLACESIYTLKKGTQNLLDKQLKKPRILHAPSALLIAYQQMIPPNKKVVSFVRLQDDEILVTIFKNQKLLVHQSYSISNISDALFYYFNATDELKLNRKEITLSIFGNHGNIEEFKTTVASNLELVKYINRLPTLQYTDEIFSHPAHHFFNLFALVLCA